MTATLQPEAAVAAPAKKSKKTLIIALVGVIALAGAGWFFFLKPSGPVEPKPGEVVTVEAIQINLAEGHYLRLGLALQMTSDAEEADGSKALDAAIELFSGLPVGEVNRAESREKLKHKLTETIAERYEGTVMEVFFTEFVTQ